MRIKPLLLALSIASIASAPSAHAFFAKKQPSAEESNQYINRMLQRSAISLTQSESKSPPQVELAPNNSPDSLPQKLESFDSNSHSDISKKTASHNESVKPSSTKSASQPQPNVASDFDAANELRRAETKRIEEVARQQKEITRALYASEHAQKAGSTNNSKQEPALNNFDKGLALDTPTTDSHPAQKSETNHLATVEPQHKPALPDELIAEKTNPTQAKEPETTIVSKKGISLGLMSAINDPYDNPNATDITIQEHANHAKEILASAVTEQTFVPLPMETTNIATLTLKPGGRIDESLLAFALENGHTLIWRPQFTWITPVETTFTGTYQRILEDVVTSLYEEGKPIRLITWTNKYAEIVDVSTR